MEVISLEDFLLSIDSKNLKLNDFWTLGNATSLWKTNDGSFLKLNFHRGPLLYALISHLKPKSILEFGTGGGYSTLCMAKALVDFNINGKIYTVDRDGNNERILRSYQLPGEQHPIEKKISNFEIWNSIAPSEWLEKIIPLKGYSGVVMREQKFKNIDFCYIDGIHTYNGTKHDFFSFLKIASPEFSVLFDDYIERDFYGVKQFIDNEIDPHFKLKLIKTDIDNDFKKFTKIDHDHGMVYLNYNSNISAIKQYDEAFIDKFLNKYRKNDILIRAVRYNLEKKFPFIKNIKFKFWN